VLTTAGLEKIDETARRVFHAQNSDLGPLIRYNTITALPTPRRKEVLEATEEANREFETFINQGKAMAVSATSMRFWRAT
jgi:hypothetical protein